MRILLDQNLAEYLHDLSPGHDVTHASKLGWHRLGNGELLDVAEQSGVEAMLTADQSVPHQNRVQGRWITKSKDHQPRLKAENADGEVTDL